jgi:cysteine-rich repeat protein
VAGFSGRLVAIYGGTCGDGIADLGEDCDDGNLTSGDGCDANCCTADADGDGFCDSHDPCDGAVAATFGLLNVKQRRVDSSGAQPFVAKVQATLPSPVVPALDPPATGMRLHLRNSIRRVADAMILPGAGWTGTGPRWRWEGNAFPGVERVTVTTKPSVPGLVKVKIRGHAPLYGLGISVDFFPPSFEVAFDAVSAADGQCTAATFPGPPPAPSCTHKGFFGMSCK